MLYQSWFASSSLCKSSQIIELLYVKHSYAYLPQRCVSELDCFVEHLCIAQFLISCIFLAYVILILV